MRRELEEKASITSDQANSTKGTRREPGSLPLRNDLRFEINDHSYIHFAHWGTEILRCISVEALLVILLQLLTTYNFNSF